MKKAILTLSVLIMALAGYAFAQSHDSIGIYLDNGLHGAIEPMGSTLDLHVIVKAMSKSELAGFELKIVAEGPLTVLSSTAAYPIQALNVASRPGEYIVGYSGPVPASSGAVEVMSLSALVMGVDTPGKIYIKPVYFSSLAGVPSYLVNAETSELVELHQSTGGPDDPVFLVNDLPVATDKTSFDGLKALYR